MSACLNDGNVRQFHFLDDNLHLQYDSKNIKL